MGHALVVALDVLEVALEVVQGARVDVEAGVQPVQDAHRHVMAHAAMSVMGDARNIVRMGAVAVGVGVRETAKIIVH